MNPRPIDQLRDRLRRSGLSKRYVKRVTAELADHFDCGHERYLEEGLSPQEAEQRAAADLGEHDALCEEILRSHAARPFIQRHPAVSFLVLPVPMLLSAVVMCAVVGVGAFLFVTRVFDVEHTNPTFRLVVLRTFYTSAYVLTPVLALGFCHLAARHRCSPWLALFACLLLCILGGLVKIDLVLCPASGSIKFFRRMGPDYWRLGIPLAVFPAYALLRFLVSRGHRVLARG